MAFNKSGVLLEGVRLGNANNPFNYPPRNFVSNTTVFSNQTNRSEYNIIVGSFDNSLKGADIGNPDLLFFWTRNEGSVFRFDYDTFSQKWQPSPGAAPDELGPISNENRLSAPVPDISVTDAPISLFIGLEIRVQEFAISYVGSELDFSSSVQQGTVELSLDSGLLNFSALDILEYEGQSVYSQRQSFFDRTKFNGVIGKLPISSSTDYFIYMNPLPASGQHPRIRIDYQRHLQPVQVPNDNNLDGAVSGTFHWSLATGRVKFSADDIDINGGKNVYYDGVYNSFTSLSITILGNLISSFPSAGFQNSIFLSITDNTRYLIFAELNKVRSYFTAQIFESSVPSSQPASGNCYINATTGQVYFNSKDVTVFTGWVFKFVDTFATIDKGVTVQFFRSSVNGSGLPTVDDFTILYPVKDQIVVDGIGEFPFAQLPTVPVIDNDLTYKVVQGPSSSGTFSGELVDGTDYTKFGFGYLLNLDQKQIRFSNRKNTSITLPAPTPSVKLNDAIISEFGFKVEKNSHTITAGVDFILDSVTGELLFLKSVGGSSENNRFGIEGFITLPSSFTSNSENQFTIDDIDRAILVPKGDNTGIYRIKSLINGKSVLVDPEFLISGSETIDVKKTFEVIANNFWVPLQLELRKFSISKGTFIDGSFTKLNNSEFSVFASNGQVNLINKAQPGEVFQVNYSYLETQDDGTEKSITTSELASFKIKQEEAITSVGSNIISFNQDGNIVDINKPIEVYLNGITQSPQSFEFITPGTISLAQPIKKDQIVVLNYYVNEAVGGESNFILQNSPLDVDKISIANGQKSISINGFWDDKIFPGTVLKSEETSEVVVINTVEYITSEDVTLLTFESPSNFDSGTSPFFYSSASIHQNRITETSTVSVITGNSTEMSVTGNATQNYRKGTIVTLDGSPFVVASSVYDETTNVTAVTFSVRTKDSYVDPVIQFSQYPVFDPGINFQTAQSANINQEFILIQMGDTRKVLIPDIDYKVAEGGSIILSQSIGSTDSIQAVYVANDFQPVGTKIDLNYAYAIVPNQSNGISGQRLIATYNLYSPDSYFYRIETVGTFLPEVQDYINNSAQSTGVSGPNTSDATGLSNKDGGSPSPYFHEQHYFNLDYTIVQLLKFYNDIINIYEDILSNIDGRVVGGEHGRFRFDGITDNPFRASYGDITNDIDDKAKLYDKVQLVSFFNFQLVPVYKAMYEPNSLSRIFPTFQSVNVAINGETGFTNFGAVLGTVGVEGVKGVSNFISAKSVSFFDAVNASATSSIITIDQNGDIEKLLPPFEVGQLATVHLNDGTPSITGTVIAASGTSVTIDKPVTASSGSIVRNISDENDTTVSRYTTGVDIGVREETGEIYNTTLPLGITEDITGNEILSVNFYFNNNELNPRRIPVLDGSILNDYGFFSVPPLRRSGENILLDQEIDHYSSLKPATVLSTSLNVITTDITASVGNQIKFLSGLNAGQTRTISAVISSVAPKSYLVSPPFVNESINETAQKLLNDGTDITTTINTEIAILNTNSAGTTGNVPVIDSELKSADSLISCLGSQITAGTGVATSVNIFVDSSASFTLAGVSSLSYLYIQDGGNFGLYKIISATSTQLTIETNASNPGTIWSSFPSISTSGNYQILDVESVLTSSGPEFLTKFIKKTNNFLNSTITWASNVTMGGIFVRQDVINNRKTDTAEFIEEIETILQKSENLYDTRYLWIQQRANREDGLLTQRVRAANQRTKDIKKLEENQRKLLIMSKL